MKAIVDNSGWLCIALAIAAALAGIALRRLRNTPPIVVRMRPHFWLGYTSLVVAAFHLWTTFPIMGMVRSRDYAYGLDAATLALLALGAQIGVGFRLQRPGKHRTLLRAAHYTIIVVLVVTIAVHIRSQR